MDPLFPSYAVLIIHLKTRQGKILSNLSHCLCFMQMSYLFLSRKYVCQMTTVTYFLGDKILDILGRKTITDIIVFTKELLIDVGFPKKYFFLSLRRWCPCSTSG